MNGKVCKGCLLNKGITEYYTEGSSLCKTCKNNGLKIGKMDENKTLKKLGKARCIDCLEIQELKNFTKRGYRCRTCTKIDRLERLKKTTLTTSLE